MSISVGKKATTLEWQRMKGSMFHLGEEVDVDLDFSRSFDMSPITSYRQTDGIWTRLVDSEVDWKLPGLKVRDLCCEAILCPKDCYGGKYFITSLLMTLTESTLSESAHDKNLEGMVNAADGCATIRMEFYGLEKWGENFMKLIKGYGSGDSIGERLFFFGQKIVNLGAITPHTNEGWEVTH